MLVRENASGRTAVRGYMSRRHLTYPQGAVVGRLGDTDSPPWPASEYSGSLSDKEEINQIRRDDRYRRYRSTLLVHSLTSIALVQLVNMSIVVPSSSDTEYVTYTPANLPPVQPKVIHAVSSGKRQVQCDLCDKAITLSSTDNLSRFTAHRSSNACRKAQRVGSARLMHEQANIELGRLPALLSAQVRPMIGELQTIYLTPIS